MASVDADYGHSICFISRGDGGGDAVLQRPVLFGVFGQVEELFGLRGLLQKILQGQQVITNRRGIVVQGDYQFEDYMFL
jgi:hypothetical protein